MTELFPVDDPHAPAKIAANDRKISFFIIERVLSRLIQSCAGLKVASPEDSDGVQTGTGRYKRIRKVYAAIVFNSR